MLTAYFCCFTKNCQEQVLCLSPGLILTLSLETPSAKNTLFPVKDYKHLKSMKMSLLSKDEQGCVVCGGGFLLPKASSSIPVLAKAKGSLIKNNVMLGSSLTAFM